MKKIARSFSVLGCLLVASSQLLAQPNYPAAPVKLVVGFPPGGPTDIVGRVFAQALSRQLGQSVIVDNRGGAGGVVAATQVARAKPDGHTLMLAVEGAQTRGVAFNPGVAKYDPIKDFTPLGKIAKQRILMVVHPSLPVANVKEFISHLRSQRPGTVTYSGTFGSSSHVGGALFDRFNGTEMTFINYPGGNQPITDLLGGVVQVGFFSESTIAQHIQTGMVKALAIAAAARSPAFPDLPTLKEAGAQPMDISPWFGLVAPAGLPPQITTKLATALSSIAVDKEFIGKLEAIGALPIVETDPQRFSAELRDELVFWTKYVEEAGLVKK